MNTAYQVLLNPLSRVQYILRQQGVDVLQETDKLDDQEFIMEVMEAREELEEANDEAEMAEIRHRNERMSSIRRLSPRSALRLILSGWC